jgi:uncharacterized protein
MLIQFRVENHRSLRDEQVLSMVAAIVGDRDDPRLIRPEGLGDALLPAVALYGANASGKSNVLHALGFMREAVLWSHRQWEPDSGTPQEPFALSGSPTKPSLVEADIVVAGVRYRYGFVLSAERVEEEWLHAWPHGRKQAWFEREGDDFEFGKNLRGENEAIRGLTRPNSLFLSAAAQNNHAGLSPVFGWFAPSRFELRWSTRTAVHVGTLGDLFFQQLSLFPDMNEARTQDKEAIVRLLRAADIGILDLRVVSRDLPAPAGALRRPTSPKRFDLHFQHRTEDGKGAWLPGEVESNGTMTLLAIATRLVGVLREGGLLCIDELEASLHPMLALEIVRLFNDPKHNPKGAQLIFTTHDTSLIGNVAGEAPLRRDQIWFTEKDQGGATKLYPLTDFHPRREENLERGYLQGRYEAIPFLGELVAPVSAEEEK